jgi:hypothetical protein
MQSSSMFEPREINIAVTGGEAQGAWKMFGARYERTVSIDVKHHRSGTLAQTGASN